MHFRLSHHTEGELVRRGIPRDLLEAVLAEPEQVIPACGGRKAYQSKIDFDDGRMFLLRAIVDELANPPVVVTVYRTSKIDKYWRTP